jgi:hypothetical protein
MEIVVEELSRGFVTNCPYKNVLNKRWTEKYFVLLRL